jgi:hypothetical protein
VLFCDDTLLVTRQSDGGSIGSETSNDAGPGTDTSKAAVPDLYTVWKKALPTVWRKY